MVYWISGWSDWTITTYQEKKGSSIMERESGMTLREAVGGRRVYGHAGFVLGLSWEDRLARAHFDDIHPGIPKILKFFDEVKAEDPAKIPVSLLTFTSRMRFREAVDLQKSGGNDPISVARFFHLFEDRDLQIPSVGCSKIICLTYPYLFNPETAFGPVLHVRFEGKKRILSVEMESSPVFSCNCCFAFTKRQGQTALSE